MANSVAVYLPQLHSLEYSVELVDYTSDMQQRWDRLFSPATPSHTLRVFTTRYTMTEALLTCLLSHAPALQQLSVCSLDKGIQDHSQQQWAVGRLEVGGKLALIKRLPRPAAGSRINVHSKWCPSLSITSQGMRDSVVARFPDYSFSFSGGLCLMPARGRRTVGQQRALQAADHPQALRRALMQLGELHAPAGIAVQLSGLQWTADMAQTVCELAPHLPHVTLTVELRNNPLTDELLGVLLQMGGHVRKVTVGHPVLQSDQHASAVWPWQQLSLVYGEPDLVGIRAYPDYDMVGLLRLPRPGPVAGKDPVLYANYPRELSMDKADAPRMCEWLQSVQLDAARHIYGARYGHVFTVHGTDDTGLIRARLSVLQAVRFAGSSAAERTVAVHLYNLPPTTDTIAVLSDLPNWGGELILGSEGAEWPADPAVCQALAAHMPVTYTTWRLAGQVPPAVVDSVCEALSERRAGLGLPPLTLLLEGRGRNAQRGDHVSIEYGHPYLGPADAARVARYLTPFQELIESGQMRWEYSTDEE